MSTEQPKATNESAPDIPLWDQLWAPRDIASVVFFRIAFALIVLLHVRHYLSTNTLQIYFGKPPHHLSYYGFEWVKALDLEGMRRVYYAMAAAAIGVGLGLLYRVSAIVLFLTLTYSFLAEAAQYQDHYYLLCLVAFVLSLIPAHRSFSVDAIANRETSGNSIPNWCRWLLMAQIAIPYIFGGVAKLNADWLHGVQVSLRLAVQKQQPLVEHWLSGPSAAWSVSLFMLVLELSIVPILLWKRTRIFAFVVLITYHLLLSSLFPRNALPWTMLFTATILLPPDWPRRILRRTDRSTERTDGGNTIARTFSRQLMIGVAGLFLTWQIIFPLRYLAYSGNPDWTEEGHNFAWRMLLRTKREFYLIHAIDGPSGRMAEVPINRILSPQQQQQLAISPDQLVANAPLFAEWAQTENGFNEVEIRAFVLTSFNGRKPQLQLDPELNLLIQNRGPLPLPGIAPLTEPRQPEAWAVPIRDWPDATGIQLPVNQ